MLDRIIALLALLALTPLFVLIAIAIKMDSPGSVFYIGKRAGKNSENFGLYKFRTMAVGADKCGPGITQQADSRITRVGKVLRKSKLDELPQLINILKGEMKLVGPRPEDPRYIKFYPEDVTEILSYRPGITSPSSIKFSNEEILITGENWEEKYINNILPEKLKTDLEYFKKNTVMTDLFLILKTIKTIFSH